MRAYSIPRQARDGLRRDGSSREQSRTIFLAAIMVLLLDVAADDRYSGGTGEPNDPYRIATAEDLNDIGNHIEDFNKCFVMTADINLAQYTGTQFNIIGSTTTFTGVFDGNYHKVWNFTWTSGGTGLFGYVGNGGQIRNLGLENVNVNAGSGTGACGLARTNDGMITNCYSSGSVSGFGIIGGLVGLNYYGTITSCYSTGSVSGWTWIGGLVGLNQGTITDCYSRCTVSTKDWGGGLVGENNGTITNCYSTGRVEGSISLRIGGLVGGNTGPVTASFWDVETSDCNTSSGGTPKTTVEMKTRSTFTDVGWDFVDETANGTLNYWRMCVDDVNYPLLAWQFVPDFVCPDGVDILDLAFFVERWLAECDQTNNFCNCTDINYDSSVNFRDFAIIASHWLEGM